MGKVIDEVERFGMRRDNELDGDFEESRELNVDTEKEQREYASKTMDTSRRDKKKRKTIETETKLTAAKIDKNVSIKTSAERKCLRSYIKQMPELEKLDWKQKRLDRARRDLSSAEFDEFLAAWVRDRLGETKRVTHRMILNEASNLFTEVELSFKKSQDSFFGACANYIVVFLTDKISSLQNAFGWLTRNQAIGEAVLLTIFTLYFGPMILFDIDFFKLDSVARVFGHINLVCYDICIYSHLIISMNRFTAIYFPFHYNEIFSKRHVFSMIFGIYFAAIAPSLYMYIYEDCHLIYQDPFWKFNFISTPACRTIMFYWDFWRYVSTVSLIAFIDILTFAKARISSVKVNITDVTARKRRHDEIKFVKQVCLQGVVFVCELLTYFILPRYFESRWVIFLLTTFAWAVVHACDGYITLFFNKEFFRLLKVSRNQSIDY